MIRLRLSAKQSRPILFSTVPFFSDSLSIPVNIFLEKTKQISEPYLTLNLVHFVL